MEMTERSKGEDEPTNLNVAKAHRVTSIGFSSVVDERQLPEPFPETFPEQVRHYRVIREEPNLEVRTLLPFLESLFHSSVTTQPTVCSSQFYV